MAERREEARYPVPEIYRNYITLKIRTDSGEFQTASLCDFSLRGIKLCSPFPIEMDSIVECLIAAPKSLSKEIAFSVRTTYCVYDEKERTYEAGAKIIETGEDLWLNVFAKVHEFMKDRMGKLY